MRGNCDKAIWVDLRRAILSGIPFFLSKNQVILSPGAIPPELCLKVLEVKTGADLLTTVTDRPDGRPAAETTADSGIFSPGGSIACGMSKHSESCAELIPKRLDDDDDEP